MSSLLPEVLDEQFISCAMCKHGFIQPKILPCLHTFCLKCLQEHVATEGYHGKFPCPTCQMTTEVPREGMAALRDDVFMTSLAEVIVAQDGSLNHCSNCDKDDIKHRCLECQQYLCTGCQEAHGWIKANKHHHILTIGDLQSGKHLKDLRKKQVVSCQIHKMKAISVMCIDCDKAICVECKEKHHAKHRMGTLECAAERDKDFLSCLSESLGEQHEVFKEADDKLNAYADQCKVEKAKLIDFIDQQRQRLVQIIDECHKELVKQITESFQDEMAKKEAIQSQILTSISSINHCRELTNKICRYGKPADVVTVAKQLKTKMVGLKFITPAEMDSHLILNYSPKYVTKACLLPMFGQIVQKRNVVPRMKWKRQSQSEEMPPRGNFAPSEVITFRARTGNDQKGCNPTGITISNENKIIIVDDINKKIKVFNQSGTAIREVFPQGEHALVDPWDIAITLDGNYAVTDRQTKKVKIFTPSGDFVSSFGDHLKSTWGIAVNSKGEIIVTDIVARSVVIHNNKGNVLFTLHTKDQQELFMCPEYVIVNINDDIIVSDFEKHCIIVFDSQGRYLYTYGNRGNGLHEFTIPCGMCHDDKGNIFIVDYNNQRLHMLSQNGQFRCFPVTAKDGLLAPQAVEMTAEGHLVVLDGSYMKVFKFPSEEKEISNPRDSRINSLHFVNLLYDDVMFNDFIDTSLPRETTV